MCGEPSGSTPAQGVWGMEWEFCSTHVLGPGRLNPQADKHTPALHTVRLRNRCGHFYIIQKHLISFLI